MQKFIISQEKMMGDIECSSNCSDGPSNLEKLIISEVKRKDEKEILKFTIKRQEVNIETKQIRPAGRTLLSVLGENLTERG